MRFAARPRTSVWSSTWLLALVGMGWCVVFTGAMSDKRRAELKEETRRLFKHGFDGYMTHAYPADELRPLSCGPHLRDPDKANFGVNDIHANASITLLDTLSSLPSIYPRAFPDALRRVCEEVRWDSDVKIQVFEMTIRGMGSLLSTYQFLDGLPPDVAGQAEVLRWEKGWGKLPDLRLYKGRVLELALDLGERLLPAFDTATGIPMARVNLKRGVEQGESLETCTAGAGSLVLEFTVLSRLTGDPRFETLAQKAYLAIWNRRSTHNLLGNAIGATHGQWLSPGMSGVGAGMDSYFEYGLKASILLADDTYFDMWQDMYSAIQTHVRTADGFIYRPVQFRLLTQSALSTIDALGAFFAGMQVLAGDVESAIKSHLIYWNLWRKHSAMPELWDWENRKVEWTGYPGRPEFIESNYYLYQATKDPFYLRVGERILKDIRERTMTDCGFATMKDVHTGDLEDRMESFVLSESLKYLYALFDDPPAKRLTNQVFTTEGHTLSLPYAHLKPPSELRRGMHKGENLFCPRYVPPTLGGGLVVGIERREDYDYARALVHGPGEAGVLVENEDTVGWWEGGRCAIPSVPRFSFEVILSPLDQQHPHDTPPEDPAPSAEKVHRNSHGEWIIANVTGLRLGVRWRLDNKGYEVATIGPHRVRSGQHVLVTDPSMEGYLPFPTSSSPAGAAGGGYSLAEAILRFSIPAPDGSGGNEVFLHAIGATATFGRDFSVSPDLATPAKGKLALGSTAELMLPASNRDGCRPYRVSDFAPSFDHLGKVLLVARGECTFAEKASHAEAIGADGILVIGTAAPFNTGYDPSHQGSEGSLEDYEGLIRPSAEGESEKLLARLESLGVVYIENTVGEVVKRIMEVEKRRVMVEMLQLDGATDADLGAAGLGGSGKPIGLGLANTAIEDEILAESESRDAAKERDGRGNGRGKEGRERGREGRVMVAGYYVWNLRILEQRPP